MNFGLINKTLFENDKNDLINKIKNVDYIIFNGSPITKLILGSDKFDYGLIRNIELLKNVGLSNSNVIYARNTVIRDNNERLNIENKLVKLYSLINI